MEFAAVMALAWNPSIGVPMLVGGVVVWGLVYLFGRPRQEQGRRRQAPAAAARDRREPVIGDEPAGQDPFGPDSDLKLSPLGARGEIADGGLREELERLGATLAGERGPGEQPPPVSAHRPSSGAQAIIEALRSPSLPDESLPSVTVDARPAVSVAAPAAATESPLPAASVEPARVPPTEIGKRPAHLPIDRIVSLYVVAREDRDFAGSDLIVAAEKAGLEFGDMNIFHRLQDGKRDQGPIFSVANMLKPGSFDLAGAARLRSPGLSFFMTLPAPVPALDAWDAMLPTAQRMAELLDGLVLDEERNALGRQRIAHIRDELRSWDRDHGHSLD
ncbi:cell division protein ZipA [Frateuria aurantia]